MGLGGNSERDSLEYFSPVRAKNISFLVKRGGKKKGHPHKEVQIGILKRRQQYVIRKKE